MSSRERLVSGSLKLWASCRHFLAFTRYCSARSDTRSPTAAKTHFGHKTPKAALFRATPWTRASIIDTHVSGRLQTSLPGKSRCLSVAFEGDLSPSDTALIARLRTASDELGRLRTTSCDLIVESQRPARLIIENKNPCIGRNRMQELREDVDANQHVANPSLRVAGSCH
jgi:hypothetical protein